MYRLYLAFILTLIFSTNSFGSYLVLSSKESSVKERLSLPDIKNIFLGKKIFWNDGSRIYRVHIKQDSDQMKKFLESILKMTSREFNKYWRRKLFAGKGHPPTEFKTEEEALNYISKNAGSVGIVGSKPEKYNDGLYFFKPDSNGKELVLIK